MHTYTHTCIILCWYIVCCQVPLLQVLWLHLIHQDSVRLQAALPRAAVHEHCPQNISYQIHRLRLQCLRLSLDVPLPNVISMTVQTPLPKH